LSHVSDKESVAFIFLNRKGDKSSHPFSFKYRNEKIP
jgi:hypothetical protein